MNLINFNYNFIDEDGRVYKDVIQSNFDLAEKKLNELLSKEYVLPTINDVNNITVNDISIVDIDTSSDRVFNLKSFIELYKLYSIPYDIVRVSKNVFDFKFLNKTGTVINIKNFTAIPELGRYLVIIGDDTVIQMSSITVDNEVIAYLEHDDEWTFISTPIPFKKNLESCLFESFTPKTIDTTIPVGTGEITVFDSTNKAFVMTSNPNTIRITEGF